jgi:hypothetical protein
MGCRYASRGCHIIQRRQCTRERGPRGKGSCKREGFHGHFHRSPRGPYPGGTEHRNRSLRKNLDYIRRDALGRSAGLAVIQAIHLDAIRTMATEEYGRPLDDKEWAGLSQQEKWKKCQNSGHMGVKLATQRATKVFEILFQAPLQLAKDYMTVTIILRQKNTASYLTRPKKS